MKKCPFCKADIEDNARFCLYCMKPLNEKEVILPPQKKMHWWPFVLAAVLLITLLLVILLMPRGQNDLPQESTDEETTLSTLSTTDENTIDTTQDAENEEDTTPEDTGEKHTQQPSGTTNTNQTPEQKPNSVTTTPEDNNVTPEPSQSATPTTIPSPPEQPQKPTQSTTEPSPTTQPQTPTQNTTAPTEPEETTVETIEETTEPEVPKAEASYTYRAARAGDEFNANYSNSGNDIVITGVAQQSADGTYDIPSYIDGKKVIAIVANAFSGSNAKIVYVPATVKTIWNYAFAGCGLTDIYFRGSAIYVESKAFSGSLTIHCSASCSDRNFRYYKSCAASYGATWEEWSG